MKLLCADCPDGCNHPPLKMADLIGKIHIIVRQRGEIGYTFLCNPSVMTLSLLRESYCERKQVSLASRELWFGDVRANDEQTPKELEMVDYDFLEVKLVEGYTLPPVNMRDQGGRIRINVRRRGEKGLRFLCNPSTTSMWWIRNEYCDRKKVPRNVVQLWFGGVRFNMNEHQTLETVQMLQYDVLEVSLVRRRVLDWVTTLTPHKLVKLQLPVRFHPYLAKGKVVSLKVEYAGCWNVEVKDDRHGHFYFHTGVWKKFVDESGLRPSDKLKLVLAVRRGSRSVSFVASKL